MNEQKPVAALFDLDGVVLDTESQYSRFWDEVGRKYYPDVTNFGNQIKGQTLTQIYDGHFKGMTEVQAEITAQLNVFEKGMDYVYIPGVEGFMNELRRQKVRIAIVTSSNQEKMKQVFAAHPELLKTVDRVLTAEDFARSKPAPDCFLLGANVFETPIENCVVFEDSFHGLAAGRAAGMKVVGLATTNLAHAIEGKCNLVINDFTEFGYAQMIELLRNS